MKSASLCGIVGSLLLIVSAISNSIDYGGIFNFDEYIAPIVLLIFTFSFYKRLTTVKS